MRKILAVATKELKQIARDPLTLFMLLGLPAFMLVVFGYAISFDVEDVRLAVEDRDLSPASRDLAASLVNSGRFAVVASLAPEVDLDTFFERRGATAVLVVPEGFSADLAAGRTAPVQFLIDGTDSTTASNVLGYADGIAAQVNAALARRWALAGGGGAALAAAVSVEPRVWYNPELDSTFFLVPGLMAFILMITAVLSTALSLVREKERGTLEQLRVAPVAAVEVLAGKMLPYLGIALTAAVLILAAARVLFGLAVQGSYLALFAATLLYLIGCFGFGLFISTIADTQAVAFQMGIFTSMLPTLILSGFVFPIRNMPEPLQILTYAVPARYYLVALRGIVLKGTGLGPYWPQMLALGTYSCLVLALAARRFARREG